MQPRKQHVLLLWLLFYSSMAEALEPISTTIAVGMAAALTGILARYQNIFYYFHECCRPEWISFNITSKQAILQRLLLFNVGGVFSFALIIMNIQFKQFFPPWLEWSSKHIKNKKNNDVGGSARAGFPSFFFPLVLSTPFYPTKTSYVGNTPCGSTMKVPHICLWVTLTFSGLVNAFDPITTTVVVGVGAALGRTIFKYFKETCDPKWIAYNATGELECNVNTWSWCKKSTLLFICTNGKRR